MDKESVVIVRNIDVAGVSGFRMTSFSLEDENINPTVNQVYTKTFLNKKTVPELLAIALELGITTVNTDNTKTEIIDAIILV